MRKRLFLICPTDYLESVICERFEGQHYFLTSIGNSMEFDKRIVEHIEALIEQQGIVEITFVLSNRNDIVFDALSEKTEVNIKTLRVAYSQIQAHRKQVSASWPEQQKVSLIISYFLNERIKELSLKLSQNIQSPLEINGQLYSKPYDRFTAIYSNLFCIRKHNLN